jgi:hypothetical protein
MQTFSPHPDYVGAIVVEDGAYSMPHIANRAPELRCARVDV